MKMIDHPSVIDNTHPIAISRTKARELDRGTYPQQIVNTFQQMASYHTQLKGIDISTYDRPRTVLKGTIE